MLKDAAIDGVKNTQIMLDMPRPIVRFFIDIQCIYNPLGFDK